MEPIFQNKFKKTYLRNSYSNHEEQKNLFLEESSKTLNLIYSSINDFYSKMQKIFSIEEINKLLSKLLFNNRRNLEMPYLYVDSFEYRNLQLSRFENDSQEPMFNNKIKLNIIAYYDIEGPMLYYDNTI